MPRKYTYLTEQAKSVLKRRYYEGETAVALATEYNVAPSTVGRIVRDTKIKWDRDPVTPYPKHKKHTTHKKLAEVLTGDKASPLTQSPPVYIPPETVQVAQTLSLTTQVEQLRKENTRLEKCLAIKDAAILALIDLVRPLL